MIEYKSLIKNIKTKIFDQDILTIIAGEIDILTKIFDQESHRRLDILTRIAYVRVDVVPRACG